MHIGILGALNLLDVNIKLIHKYLYSCIRHQRNLAHGFRSADDERVKLEGVETVRRVAV